MGWEPPRVTPSAVASLAMTGVSAEEWALCVLVLCPESLPGCGNSERGEDKLRWHRSAHPGTSLQKESQRTQ